jgi:hypothetical protein
MRRNAGRKQPAVAVRSFLRFLVFRGDIRPGLEAAAPSPPQWKYAALPSRLTPEDIARVLPYTTMGAPSVCVTVPSSSSLRVLASALRTWSRCASMISIGRMGALPCVRVKPAGHAPYPSHTMSVRLSWPTYKAGDLTVRVARSLCAVGPRFGY